MLSIQSNNNMSHSTLPMPLITDHSTRHCYEAAAWNLILVNSELRRLFLTKNCNAFKRVIRCFESNECELHHTKLVQESNLKKNYDKLVNTALQSEDLQYEKDQGGLPTYMLLAILMEHEKHIPRIKVSDKIDVTEECEVV
jgi:hypothetical protein